MKKLTGCLVAIGLAGASYAAGFGIYEASSRGNAVGGTLIADTFETDATANYYNPANIAFATNIQLAVGATLINPYCDVKVDGRTQDRMNPGWFAVPTFFLTVPLPMDFVFGLGGYTEFGLGTRYGTSWDLAGDTQKTTMRQFTLNPNLAYKVTDRWAVSGGLRFSWIQFNNHKSPYNGDTLYHDVNTDTAHGTLSAPNAYHLNSRLKGEDWGVGWNAGTTFKATDDLSFGLVYRSQIKHKIKGDYDMYGNVSGDLDGDLTTPMGTFKASQLAGMGMLDPTALHVHQYQREHGSASAKLRLPRSIAAGVNWRATEKWRIGGSVTWTEWSSVKNIDFKLPYGHSFRQKLHWNDVWRFGIGTEYDILDWLTIRGGYVYDMDPSSKHYGTSMIPSGDRHIIGSGLGLKITENLSLDIGYSFIRMNNDDRFIKVTTREGQEKTSKFATHNGFSHLVSATVKYSF